MNALFFMIIKNIQFPWRFLGICCFFLTVTMVCLLCLLEEGKSKFLYYTVFVLLGALFIVSADYYMYRFTQEADLHRYIDEAQLDTTAVVAGEYLLKSTPDNFWTTRHLFQGRAWRYWKNIIWETDGPCPVGI